MLIEDGAVVKYNNQKQVRKSRKVEHVCWFESMQEGQNSNKFIAVFDDGTFYVFFRTKAFEEQKLDKVIRIPKGSPDNSMQLYQLLNDPNFEPRPGLPEYKEYTREKIVKILQQSVEGVDFDKFYSTSFKQRNMAGPSDVKNMNNVELIETRTEDAKYSNVIAVQMRIYT